MEYDVTVEYGGSVEYDASLEFDVVVCTKRTKDKEKHYLKITARIITYIIPQNNRMGLTTHGLIEISDLRETFMMFCEFLKTTTLPPPLFTDSSRVAKSSCANMCSFPLVHFTFGSLSATFSVFMSRK